MLGITTSTPSCSFSGYLRPASKTKIEPFTSSYVEVFPFSRTPPKVINLMLLMFSPLCDGSYLRSLAHQVELQFCNFLAYLEHYTIFSRFFSKVRPNKSPPSSDGGTHIKTQDDSIECQLAKETLVRMIVIFLFSITRIAALIT